MSNQGSPNGVNPEPSATGKLRLSDITAIERALAQVGPFGEVHLVIENSRLRFIRTVRSDTFNHSSGSSGNSSRE